MLTENSFGILSFGLGLASIAVLRISSAVHTMPEADSVLINGKIVTVDKNFSIVQAVAIQCGKLIAVGTNDEVKSLIGPNTKVIDLRGKTVTPGFIDGHAHMDREGLRYFYPSLEGAKTKAEILARIEQETQKVSPGEWVVTTPVGQPPFYFDTLDLLRKGEIPNRWDLDKVAPNNPVYIRHIWGYWNRPPLISIANSKALEVGKITENTVSPYAGVQIDKDLNTGQPTGIFLEWSYVPTIEFNLFKDAPRFTHAMRVEALKKSMEVYNSYGTTSIYEGHGIAPEVIWVYKDLWTQRKMNVRSYLVISPSWDAGKDNAVLLRDWAAYAGGKGFGDDMLNIGGVFLQLGGNPDVARLCKAAIPYTAWGAYIYDSTTPQEFEELTFTVINGGFRFNSIAASPTPVLNVLEKVGKVADLSKQRIVLEHLSLVTQEDIERMKKLGVVVTTIPASTIWKYGSDTYSAMTQKTPDLIMPLKSIMEKGIPAVLCTDNVPPSMLHAIWTTVARKDRLTGQVISPSQRLSREQALRGATINGAYLLFAEDKIGSIEQGKLADLVVLDEDIMSCPEDKIKDIKVLMTMVGGRAVYTAAGGPF